MPDPVTNLDAKVYEAVDTLGLSGNLSPLSSLDQAAGSLATAPQTVVGGIANQVDGTLGGGLAQVNNLAATPLSSGPSFGALPTIDLNQAEQGGTVGGLTAAAQPVVQASSVGQSGNLTPELGAGQLNAASQNVQNAVNQAAAQAGGPSITNITNNTGGTGGTGASGQNGTNGGTGGNGAPARPAPPR
jgi:hypothetical protein